MPSKVLSLSLIVSLLFAAAALAAENNPVLAKAGDYVIRQSDLDRIISYYPPDKRKILEENPQQRVNLLKRMLEVKVIADVTRKEGFDQRPDMKEQIRLTVDNFLASEYLSKVVTADVKVTDSDVKQYYDLNKSKFAVPDEAHARHILIRVASGASEQEKAKARAEAEEVLQKLRKGADFGKLAEQYSEDPATKSKGGDLGYFAKGRMIKPLEEVVFSLKPGETSGIVETEFGYHIIKLEDIRKARTKTLDEVRDAIRKQLLSDLSRGKASDFVAKVFKESGAEVYADRVMPGKTAKEDKEDTKNK